MGHIGNPVALGGTRTSGGGAAASAKRRAIAAVRSCQHIKIGIRQFETIDALFAGIEILFWMRRHDD